MKFISFLKQFLIIFLKIKIAVSFTSLSNYQDLKVTSAKRDYIYWTPTTANIIDSPRDERPSPFPQVATPYTFNNYPSDYNLPVYYPVNSNVYWNSYIPTTSYYNWRKEAVSTPNATLAQSIEKNASVNFNFKFKDVISELKNLKTDLFGNPEADMKIYRKNKIPYYDSRWIQRAHKIVKVLELEELLQFYNDKSKKITVKNEINDPNKRNSKFSSQKNKNQAQVAKKETPPKNKEVLNLENKTHINKKFNGKDEIKNEDLQNNSDNLAEIIITRSPPIFLDKFNLRKSN